MTAWRAILLDEGDYADQPALNVVRDDEEQERVLAIDVPPGQNPTDILTANGWRLDGPWEPGVDGRHAPVARTTRGRISRGARAETKLPPTILTEVETLIGSPLGTDRSEVIASLVQLGLAAHRASAPPTKRG